MHSWWTGRDSDTCLLDWIHMYFVNINVFKVNIWLGINIITERYNPPPLILKIKYKDTATMRLYHSYLTMHIFVMYLCIQWSTHYSGKWQSAISRPFSRPNESDCVQKTETDVNNSVIGKWTLTNKLLQITSHKVMNCKLSFTENVIINERNKQVNIFHTEFLGA